MGKSYDRVMGLAFKPWALERPLVSVIAHVLAQRLAGGDHQALDLVPIQAPPRPSSGTSAAIIPIHGVIAPRMRMFADISGGTSFDALTVELREAVADASIGTIILDMDSSGGSCAGAPEFAAEVRKARATKPVIASVAPNCCSAAYWVASNATQVVATPSGMLGSIGVFTVHEDLSAMLATLGVKITYLAEGKYKVQGNETEPLDDQTRAHLMKQVTHFYSMFIRDVALGRGVSEATVRGGYGEGAVVNADDALALGMIDRIETLDETITRVTTGTPPGRTLAATAQERDAATAQERQWASDTERAFVEWALAGALENRS